MMACAIGITGPPPSPWRIRMATRKCRLGAIPDKNELAVKRTAQARKNRRRPNRAVSQPVAGMTTALAARNEVITHDISSTPADSEPCMCGSATFVTLVSSTCMTVTIITDTVMAHRWAPDTGASPGGAGHCARATSPSAGRLLPAFIVGEYTGSVHAATGIEYPLRGLA